MLKCIGPLGAQRKPAPCPRHTIANHDQCPRLARASPLSPQGLGLVQNLEIPTVDSTQLLGGAGDLVQNLKIPTVDSTQLLGGAGDLVKNRKIPTVDSTQLLGGSPLSPPGIAGGRKFAKYKIPPP